MLRIEEELNKLKISEASSTTTNAEKICSGLLSLNEVYKCLDEHCKGFHIADKGADLESAIRRKKGDSRIQISTAKYVSFRKEMNKGAKKLIKDVKQIDNKIASLPLLDQLEDDHHVTTVIRVPLASPFIIPSSCSFPRGFRSRSPRVGPNCWTKAEWRVKSRRGYELQRVDVALSNIWQCGGSSEVGENMKMAQMGLRSWKPVLSLSRMVWSACVWD
ncbi:hypothetical protein C3L33_17844, partial [Rhododendron williamsianum]